MSNDTIHIFMVEDDLNFGAVLKSYLEINTFVVEWIRDGAKALEAFREKKFDICILDIMLPNVDGFTIAKEIRSLDKIIPLIFLTAKTLKKDVLEGFNLGADDYITKPFDSEVLICKINAILRRNIMNEELESITENIHLRNYVFSTLSRTLIYKGNEEKLSPKEASLLTMLYQYKNRILPREKALESIWGECNYFTTRSMDVFISKLRKLLQHDKRIEIINIHSSGYRLEVHD